MIQRFNERFPGLYVNACWPTNDRIIPAARFVWMASPMGALEAAEMHREVRSGALGQALAENGKDGAVKSEMGKLKRAGYPEVYE